MRTPTYELVAIALLALVTGCVEEPVEPDDMVDPVAKLGASVAVDVTSTTVGTTECAAPKVLVCHIPPGNPENMHAICVGQSAVAPHLAQHGDTIGSCNATRVATPPVCQPFGGDCSVDGDCCSGACNASECIDRV